jgi:hypothetical protein
VTDVVDAVHAISTVTFGLYFALAAYLVLVSLRILGKAGLSGWWAVLSTPPLVLVTVWVFAFARWPREASGPRPPASPGGG